MFDSNVVSAIKVAKPDGGLYTDSVLKGSTNNILTRLIRVTPFLFVGGMGLYMHRAFRSTRRTDTSDCIHTPPKTQKHQRSAFVLHALASNQP